LIKVGQPEIATQKRIKALFRDVLGYQDLGNWELRANSNVEEAYLCKFLTGRGVAKGLVDRAVAEDIRQNLDNQQDAAGVNFLTRKGE
jgi:hypothetical protein